ncbi:MAG TPA: bifunctional [glutamine synthetase] adenylyltransferase/[glutamine synthetase]-adenylyl-L-tyrosine phosphorylase [Rhizomicrobium sp.]|nr:bifunctional [glutamine synthetase] adenylyltransferase/[glutamine synthetase]-adenylyl-L-tyrosine phosphorylase [Rhizomicrobium sp.]
MPDLHVPPLPFDSARVQRTLETLGERGFLPDANAQTLLDGVFGNSPFLSRLAVREPEALGRYFQQGPDAALRGAIALAEAVADLDDEALAMRQLREAKRVAALTIALADIAGVWMLNQVTAALSQFADASVRGALRFLLRKAADLHGMREQDGAVLEATTGLTVLAMGKYGAHELNYSSDIDLVVFYDAGRFPFAKRGDARGAAVDIVRGLVKLLAEVTSDGYVFRTDLRLRPDAGATQVAISLEAAEAYYESLGQNWERAAMIKARPCAGDPETGAAFRSAIEPFIWRRNLDFAAIEDIHSIKRQIHAHAGHSEIAVAGHNIKLGRGGIREIEFFAQTQQLILGGRHASLRAPATLDALAALAAHGTITEETAADLTRAYDYLRTLEHRLQMIEDEQTHTVPKSSEGVAHVSCFMGYDDVDQFRMALTGTLESVQGHYARLFQREVALTDVHGSLVFTGVEDDPETLETLRAMGFGAPSQVAGAIRAWHHGRIRAMRSARARELLTKLIPAILKALAATADPDAAFVQFDRFLSNLPSGVQLFSLFLARPEFLSLLANVVGSAPRLAIHLARTPATLDALLDAGFLGSLPDRALLGQSLSRQLQGDYEEQLDGARRFAREENFRVGVQLVDGAAKAEEAGAAFARVAESVIGGLLPVVESELAINAGRVPGAEFTVIALGKLGGREMTASSDLDLVFVYDVPDGVESSDGAKPLSPTLYFARLAQRLIAALTTPTGAGTLYEVDMRLRPSGNKGPAAVSLKTFADYHERESWTWEHLALTRARLVAGPKMLGARVEAEIATRLAQPREASRILADAREMRGKIAAQYPGKNRWDLKYAPGGLIDIEFLAQALQLIHAPARPDILDTNTVAALKKVAAAGFLREADARILIEAAALEQALTQILRIALDETLDAATASAGLKGLLARAGGVGDFDALERELGARQDAVRAVFNRLMAG